MKKTAKDSPIPYTLAGAVMRSTYEAVATGIREALQPPRSVFCVRARYNGAWVEEARFESAAKAESFADRLRAECGAERTLVRWLRDGVPTAGKPVESAPAPKARLGRTPDTVPANTSADLHEGGQRAASVGQRADSESARPYAIDAVKAELRRKHWPDCRHCERLEGEVLEAGTAVRVEMVKLCADYPAMYLEDVRVWEQSVAPVVARLKAARIRRDKHQKQAGHES